MKIRIQRNSVRFRLSRTEVEQLSETGYIQEDTIFGASRFSYAVATDAESDALSATFENGKITMSVPASFAENWADNNVVGTNGNMPLDDESSLYLLIEKDFKCLDNVAEDQSDNYENPSKTC